MTTRELTWTIVLGTAFAIFVLFATGGLALIGYAISMMGASQ